MALALVTDLTPEPGEAGLRVRFDIGRNRYLSWVVGQERTRSAQGLAKVSAVVKRSGLIGPIPEQAFGRGEFVIPKSWLTSQSRWLQLVSFRESDGVGPAISDIVALPVSRVDGVAPDTALRAPHGFGYDVGIQTMASSLASKPVSKPLLTAFPGGGNKMSASPKDERQPLMHQQSLAVSAPMVGAGDGFAVSQSNQPNLIAPGPVRSKPFTLRQRPYSQPFFLDAILGALPNIIPLIQPAIGAITGAISGGGRQTQTNIRQTAPTRRPSASPAVSRRQPQRPTGQAPQQAIAQIGQLAQQVLQAVGTNPQQLMSPENLQLILRFIQQSGAGTGAQAGAQAGTQAGGQTGAQAGAQAGSQTGTLTGAQVGGQVGARAQSLVSPMSTGLYSQAQVAPALLAALPALMPLLQQVLSPQTVQSIVQAPERMTGQIINGITDFARLGLQADQQLHEHLRELNPGVDDPALHQLLASLSVGFSRQRNIQYRRVASVQLMVDSVPTQVVAGREVALYLKGAPWQFPITVQTPQTISKAHLKIQLKEADTLKVVWERQEPVGSLSSGALPVVPRVDANVTQGLGVGQDYIVELTLLWKNRQGQWRGSSVHHSVAVMSEYRFDRIEESSQLIALSDRQQFGDYWHAVWELEFDTNVRRMDVKTRYFLTLDVKEQAHARLQTQLKRQTENARAKVQARSGYEYSLYGLNHLRQRVLADQAPLSQAELEALQTPEFMNRFKQAAQHQTRLRGRPEDAITLWVFPTIKLQSLVLLRAAKTDQNGVVTELTELTTQFPIPVMMHFVGVWQS